MRTKAVYFGSTSNSHWLGILIGISKIFSPSALSFLSDCSQMRVMRLSFVSGVSSGSIQRILCVYKGIWYLTRQRNKELLEFLPQNRVFRKVVCFFSVPFVQLHWVWCAKGVSLRTTIKLPYSFSRGFPHHYGYMGEGMVITYYFLSGSV